MFNELSMVDYHFDGLNGISMMLNANWNRSHDHFFMEIIEINGIALVMIHRFSNFRLCVDHVNRCCFVMCFAFVVREHCCCAFFFLVRCDLQIACFVNNQHQIQNDRWMINTPTKCRMQMARSIQIMATEKVRARDIEKRQIKCHKMIHLICLFAFHWKWICEFVVLVASAASNQTIYLYRAMRSQTKLHLIVYFISILFLNSHSRKLNNQFSMAFVMQ